MFSNKNQEPICPMLKKPCIKHECAWYVHIRGTNPQTGAEVDNFNCTMAIQPMLLIENSAMQRQTGAAVESFRNELIKNNSMTIQLLSTTINERLKSINSSNGRDDEGDNGCV